MFVYVYILNKIYASRNAVPLILMTAGEDPFYDKHIENQHGLAFKKCLAIFLQLYFAKGLLCRDLSYLSASL